MMERTDGPTMRCTSFSKGIDAAIVGARSTHYSFSFSIRLHPIFQVNSKGNLPNNQTSERSDSAQPSTMSADNKLIFKCKCGAIQATLQGLPVQNVNCHCHSCVSSAKSIESNPTFNGFSLLDVGGVAYANFRWRNINFTTPDMTSNEARDKISFVKIGEKDKVARSYCTSRGTMLGIFYRTESKSQPQCHFQSRRTTLQKFRSC